MSKKYILPAVLSLIGILLVIFLFQLPKFVVENEDQGMVSADANDSESSKKEEALTEEHGKSMTEKELKKASTLRNQFDKEQDSEKKLIFADSLAELYFQSFKFDESLQFYKYIAANDTSSFAIEKAGEGVFRIFKISKDPKFGKQAKEYFEKASELSDAPELKAKIAFISALTSGGAPMTHILKVRELKNQHPENIEILSLFGELLITSGQYDKARDVFIQALALEEQNLQILSLLAETYYNLGEKDQALVQLNKIQEINNGQDPFYEEFVRRYKKIIK